VLNRANARLPMFEKPSDYQAFETALLQAVERANTRLLAYYLMPNHFFPPARRADQCLGK